MTAGTAARALRAALEGTTPGPWIETGASTRYGGVVGPAGVGTRPIEIEGYGGQLVAESMSPPDRGLISLLRDLAVPVADALEAHEAGDPAVVAEALDRLAAAVTHRQGVYDRRLPVPCTAPPASAGGTA